MDRFLRWFGLKPADQNVRDYINKSNLNLAVYTSALVMVIEFSLLLEQLGKVIMSGFSDKQAITLVLLHTYMTALSYALEVVSTNYFFKGKYGRRSSSIVIYLFTTSTGAYTAFISLFSESISNFIMMFSILMLVSLCFFTLRPIYIVSYVAILFIGFYATVPFVEHQNFLSMEQMRRLIIIAAVAVLVASISRYHFTYRAGYEHIKLERMTRCDWLTGLLNRQMMKIRFEGNDYKEPFRGIVMMADLDDFQFFNDLYGADEADQALRAIAEIIMQEFGEDNSYRFGGDEYLVTYPCEESSLDDLVVRSKMTHFMTEISKYAEPIHNIDLTISVGYVYGEAGNEDEIHLMHRQANRNLITAKRIGKNQAVGDRYRAGVAEEDLQLEAQRVYKNTDADTLTGLPNMVNFRNYSQRLIHRMEQEGKEDLCVLYFDIENFKSYNQNYGFQMGDQLLKNIGNKLSQVFEDGLVSRFSSDHFLVLTNTQNVVERIHEIHEFVHEYQRGMRLEIKAGIYMLEDHGNEIGLAIDRAKMALSTIKKRYDANYKIYDSSMEKDREKKQYIVDHMDEAMAKGWIKVFYQPVVRTLTGEICGVEALARWEDPLRGKISPADFIEVLEEAHLIHYLDLYILEKVCKTFTTIKSENLFKQPASINLSRYDFQLSNIYEQVNEIVESYEVPKDLIHIEITESALTDDPAFLRQQIKKFHDGGYQVWMDDFGSGYSSLNTLKDFKFDVLKLDMAFLKNFDTNPKVPLIISSIINMAKYMGIQTLAEGVETREQAEFLRTVGCEKMQGFLFGIPMSRQTIAKMNEEIPFKTENPSSREYLDKVGRINMLSSNPLDEMNGWEYNNPVPMGIIEYSNGYVKYMNCNRAFRNYVGSMGFVSVKEVENYVNDPETDLYEGIRQELEYCLRTAKEHKLTFAYKNAMISTYCKLIAKDEKNGKMAFLISAADRLISRQDEVGADSLDHDAVLLWLSTRGLAEILGYEGYDDLLSNAYNFEIDLTEDEATNFYFGTDFIALKAIREASGTYTELVDQIVDGLTADPMKRKKMKKFYDRERLIEEYKQGIQYGNTEDELDWDGKRHWLHTNYQLRETEDGHLHASFLVYNIGQFRQTEHKMWQLANTDPLTGLFNRNFAETKIHSVLETITEDRTCALIQIDLDDFKSINDSNGHECGDAALITVARYMMEVFPGQAIISRTGGDEFLVFIERCEEEDVKKYLDKLIEGTTCYYGGKKLQLAFSVGYTMIPDQAIQYEEAVRNADTAMYESKSRGKGCYTKFEERMMKQWKQKK